MSNKGRQGKMNRSTIARGCGICAVAVMFFLMVLVPICRNRYFIRQGEPVVGTTIGTINEIARSRTRYVPWRMNIIRIEYYVDGQAFTQSLREHHRGLRPGMEIQLFYNPDNPRNVTTGGLPSGARVDLLIASASMIAGIAMIIRGKQGHDN